MSYRNPHSRAGLSGSVTIFMLIAMMAAAASGSLGSRRERAGASPTVMHAVPAQKLRWTLDDIHALITAIEDSEKQGFDSRRYGLAALKSELEQTTELWGRPGTHQLDMLANSSALALANDYRGRAGLTPVSARDVDAVLVEGNLHSWLTATGA